MVAFIASLVVTGLMIAIGIVVARRRPPGTEAGFACWSR